MRYLKSLEIIFENCEHVTIPANMIGDIHMGGTKYILNRVAANAIGGYNLITEFYIELFKTADKIYHPFGIESDENSILTRISEFNDITGIDIEYEDGTVEEYLVDYDEKDDSLGSPNKNQKTYVSHLGNVYVVIQKDKKIEDFFDLEKINDEEKIKYLEDCYDIGVEKQYDQEYSKDNLPDMYRYVYLNQGEGANSKQALAIRVFDKTSGWKFVFESANRDIVDVPDSFVYPTSVIDEFINESEAEKKTGFSMDEIIKNYPIPKKAPAKDSALYKYYIESKEAIKKYKNK